jgi:hypothetical protein
VKLLNSNNTQFTSKEIVVSDLIKNMNQQIIAYQNDSKNLADTARFFKYDERLKLIGLSNELTKKANEIQLQRSKIQSRLLATNYRTQQIQYQSKIEAIDLTLNPSIDSVLSQAKIHQQKARNIELQLMDTNITFTQKASLINQLNLEQYQASQLQLSIITAIQQSDTTLRLEPIVAQNMEVLPEIQIENTELNAINTNLNPIEITSPLESNITNENQDTSKEQNQNIDPSIVQNNAQIATQQNNEVAVNTTVKPQNGVNATTTNSQVVAPEIKPTQLTNINSESRVVITKDIQLEELKLINPETLSAEQRVNYEEQKAKYIGAFIDLSANSQAFYSIENPIPLDEALPKGLIFKVQIAASVKLVDDTYFKGLSPITADRIPNSKFIRYYAGFFTNFDDANFAKNQIRKMAYKDAFVVAYFNGLRISLLEARNLIDKGEAFTDPDLLKSAIAFNIDNYGQDKAQITAGAIPEAGTESQLKAYYTIQVGVFGGPRTSERLNNISDLFYNRTPKGLYCYFSGHYLDMPNAIQARNQVRQQGFVDAFIVPMMGGVQVPLAQAQTVINSTQQVQINPNQKENSQVDVIEFRVQLGAFFTLRTGAQLQSLEQLSTNGLDTYNAGKFVIYTTKGTRNYQEAVQMLTQVKARGANDAFIVAIRNGQKVNLQEARAILNQ